MPQFDISTYASQVFWLLVSWSILFIYLWKILVPKMSKKLSDRESSIKKILSEAEHLDIQSGKLIFEYNQKLQEARQKQKEKLQNVTDFIRASKETLEVSLKKDLDDMIGNYEVSLKQSQKELLQMLPEKLEASIVSFLEQHLSFKLEDKDEIRRLLTQEIEKLENHD